MVWAVTQEEYQLENGENSTQVHCSIELIEILRLRLVFALGAQRPILAQDDVGKKLVGGIAEGWDALLHVENQLLSPQGPIALGILGYDFLREREGAAF